MESFKKEVQIAILAVVGSLGFFKVEDLKSFVNILTHLMINDIDKTGDHDISVYFCTAIAGFAYTLYFFTFAFALIQMFQGKNITITVLISVSCFFVMYFFLIILVLKEPKLMSHENASKALLTPLSKVPRLWV